MEKEDFYNNYKVGDSITIRVGDKSIKVVITNIDEFKVSSIFYGDILRKGVVKNYPYEIKYAVLVLPFIS